MENRIKKYREELNLKEAVFTLIDHDHTMIALVYRVTQLDGTSLILKISSEEEDYRRELYFLRYLEKKYPSPLLLDSIEPHSNIYGAILMECFEGDLLQERDWSDSLAFEIGANLAKLHTNRTAAYGDLIREKTLLFSSREYFEKKFKEELSECMSHFSVSLIEKIQSYFDAHSHYLDKVDGPCIVHRDFRPGNIIVNQGKLQGIIDWASARSGFAEQDLCTMIHPKYKKSLLEGYRSIRKVPKYELVMPLLQLSRALAVIGYAIKSNTWNSSNRDIYIRNCRFLELFNFSL
ncbi:MAG: hypothetical protein CMO81_07375 [Waddliaceae bacterium]|nr:hypothetical protein [Waddliaceae bacterium]